MGFEPKIPFFERKKTIHALDRTATVIGPKKYTSHVIKWSVGMRGIYKWGLALKVLIMGYVIY
jgi:hypothetical protein